jgi:hypothetical protein
VESAGMDIKDVKKPQKTIFNFGVYLTGGGFNDLGMMGILSEIYYASLQCNISL